MAINLAHRPDLDSRVERLADRLGLKGRGRKTATIERALTLLEKHVAQNRPGIGRPSRRRLIVTSPRAPVCASV